MPDQPDAEAVARRRARDEHEIEAARRRYRVETLIGMDVETARKVVEGAGGCFESYQVGVPAFMTMDIRGDRVRAFVSQGCVVEADVG